MQASVNNVFENTDITQESVDQSIKEAIANPASSNTLLGNATFTSEYFSCNIQLSKSYFGRPDMYKPQAMLFQEEGFSHTPV